ncbi:MAG: hypothetical protein ACE5H9_10555 [Anaerolineae bacterium]
MLVAGCEGRAGRGPSAAGRFNRQTRRAQRYFRQRRVSNEAEARRWNLPYLLAILHRGYGAFHTGRGAWAEAEAAFQRALAATRGTAFWYQDVRT